MALYNKSDMVYNDYSWTAYGDDDPKVTGKPDSTLFNRKEGYEVLYLINKFAKQEGLDKVETCKEIEKLIRNKLPGDTRSQEKVIEWLKKNYK